MNYMPNNLNPDFNPEHDSVFVRFEQLQVLLGEAGSAIRSGLTNDAHVRLRAAQALVWLIREQVIK